MSCRHAGASRWRAHRLQAWDTYGLHAFRVVDGAAIDWPLDTTTGERRWVATIWADPDPAVGWLRDLWSWSSGPRGGWTLSPRLVRGEVVEFGADLGEQARRWYGVVTSYDGAWLILEGPVSGPEAAERLAERRLDELRHRRRGE